MGIMMKVDASMNCFLTHIVLYILLSQTASSPINILLSIRLIITQSENLKNMNDCSWWPVAG